MSSVALKPAASSSDRSSRPSLFVSICAKAVSSDALSRSLLAALAKNSVIFCASYDSSSLISSSCPTATGSISASRPTAITIRRSSPSISAISSKSRISGLLDFRACRDQLHASLAVCTPNTRSGASLSRTACSSPWRPELNSTVGVMIATRSWRHMFGNVSRM